MINSLSCAVCGTLNPSQAVFCNSCGQPFQQTAASLISSDDTLLNDRYRILEQLGQGGFGSVYKAADTSFGGRLVAIKEMEQRGLTPQQIVEATTDFKREALLLAHLRHPHLPRIYDHFNDAGHWYLVMDYIEGETLEDYQQKMAADPRTGKRQLPIGEVLEIGVQLCTVLDYLHTRQPPVIFRDLKPANVMRTADKHLYLIDFGIARHFKQGQSKDTMPLGSPGYAAPEQYGQAQTTPRADIYGLGVTLHQLLTGDDPFYMPFRLLPIQAADQQTTELGALVKRMTAIDESDRPATIALVRQELQRIAQQQNSKRIWTVPEVDAMSPLSSGGVSPTALSQQQQQMQQIFVEQERQQSSGPNNSRRRFLVGGLAGLGVVASLAAWQWFAHPGSQQALPRKVQAQPPQKALQGTDAQLIYRGHTGEVTSASWSPDGRRIASSGVDGTVQEWDGLTGKQLLSYRGQGGAVTQAIWSPDGTKIISGSISGTVQEWRASTGEVLFTYHTRPAYTNDMAWSPDGKYLAVGVTGPGSGVAGPPQKTDLVQVWDVTSHTMMHAYPSFAPEGIAWAPDSKRLAVNSTFGETTIIDSVTGDDSITHGGFGDSMRSVAWSPDGKYVASASDNDTIHVWEPANSTQALYIFGTANNGSMSAVSWSPDGKRIASGSADGSVQIWDAFTGGNLTVYRGHSDSVTSVQWSPDGRLILSSSNDGTVRIWRAP